MSSQIWAPSDRNEWGPCICLHNRILIPTAFRFEYEQKDMF